MCPSVNIIKHLRIFLLSNPFICMVWYSTMWCYHLKVIENKGNLKPETDVSKSTEYRKKYIYIIKKRTNNGWY